MTDIYAEGGYVTGPQDAIVGEGGEPEYIIPASKMSQAMSRYSSGMRGEGVIPKSATVNVSYNGSTVNMGGSDYIKRDDVPGLLSSAVNQTLTTLKKSPVHGLSLGCDDISGIAIFLRFTPTQMSLSGKTSLLARQLTAMITCLLMSARF